ncbi:MAG TPA: T9SS type A sorting domain-containing protein, partial [Candidatus Kapabacteria bacterium]|nr:T9SS type A sorting domain-containing protein [Candidatus Kapabacteria bacterium]
DTSVKRFDGGQIVWDQTNGMFNVSTPDVKAGSGFFGLEGAPFGELIISRKDAGKDMLSFYLQYAEIEPGVKVPSFFTLSTRAQNSGHEWATDSLSFAKDFGSAPVIMSGATVDLTFDVRFGLSYEFIPLDSNGKVAGASIRSEFVDGNWTQARVRIDQSKTGTPWYAVVSHQFVGSVDETDDDVQAIAFPNPVIDQLTITAGDPIKRVQIVNMVGQTMLQAAHNTSSVKLDVASLSPGAYTVIIETAKGKKTLPLRKL